MTTTKGEWEKIGGVNLYVATPSGDYPQNKAVIFLTDVFGLQIPNALVCPSTNLVTIGINLCQTQIIYLFLAVDFAANGLKVSGNH